MSDGRPDPVAAPSPDSDRGATTRCFRSHGPGRQLGPGIADPSWRRITFRTVQIGVIATATWRLALPQFGVAWSAIGSITALPLTPLLLSAGCGFVALIAYAQLLRVALGAGDSPGLWHTFGIISTTLGISNVLPGGSAVGTVVGFRMLARAGVPRSRAAVSLAFASIGSAIVLNVLLAMGLLALLPTRGLASGAIVAIPVTALLVGASLLGQELADDRSPLLIGAERLGDRFPKLIGSRLTDGLNAIGVQVREWKSDPALVGRAVVWATVNWLTDVAALWIILWAVGARVNPVVALVAFSVANIAAMVPITPGGLGVVEFALVGTMVGLGVPPVQAAAGVAIYRLFSFWLPIPLSVIAWVATTATTRPPAPAT